MTQPVTVLAMLASFALLSISMKTLPLGLRSSWPA
jgi:multidrug transporter EmrE-like cation transporter